MLYMHQDASQAMLGRFPSAVDSTCVPFFHGRNAQSSERVLHNIAANQTHTIPNIQFLL
jgi:hypothetical protein